MRILTKTVATAVCLLLAAALSGCASLGDQLQSSLTMATSAVRSAGVGLTLRDDDRATAALTATVLGDALEQLNNAATSVAQIDTAGSSEASQRAQVLDLIRRSTDAVNRARTALTTGEGMASASADIEALGDEADARLQQYQRRQAP